MKKMNVMGWGLVLGLWNVYSDIKGFLVFGWVLLFFIIVFWF